MNWTYKNIRFLKKCVMIALGLAVLFVWVVVQGYFIIRELDGKYAESVKRISVQIAELQRSHYNLEKELQKQKHIALSIIEDLEHAEIPMPKQYYIIAMECVGCHDGGEW